MTVVVVNVFNGRCRPRSHLATVRIELALALSTLISALGGEVRILNVVESGERALELRGATVARLAGDELPLHPWVFPQEDFVGRETNGRRLVGALGGIVAAAAVDLHQKGRAALFWRVRVLAPVHAWVLVAQPLWRVAELVARAHHSNSTLRGEAGRCQ